MSMIDILEDAALLKKLKKPGRPKLYDKKRRRVTGYVKPSDYDELVRIAEKKDSNTSQIVKEAVAEYIKSNK